MNTSDKDNSSLSNIGPSDTTFKFTGLSTYLDYVQQYNHVQITIKDCMNFISSMDKEIAVSLIPYLSHQNSYCNYIKSNYELHKQCLQMTSLIEKKLKKTGEAFWGVCHAGIGEYIIPIIYKSTQLLGFITIGIFNPPDHIAKHRINNLYRSNRIDIDLAIKYYSELNNTAKFDLSAIIGMFEIVAEYISLLHHQNVLSGKYIERQRVAFREEILLNKTLEYIQKNFKEDLCLQKISTFCHCSKSYLSHTFKKTTGLSLSDYTLRIRVNEAKRLLVNTDETVTNIALQTGFNDSSYFSKVFKKLTNVSPNEFRRNYK